MKLPPYIEFSIADKRGLNDYFILQTAYPGYFAQIITVERNFSEEHFHKLDTRSFKQIAGYSIGLLYKGSLPGPGIHHSFALFSGQADAGIGSALAAMADWYLIHVIGQRLSEFDHFRL